MQIVKLRSCNSLDMMRPEQKVGKPEEGNDSFDNFIRQAIGKEPALTFSRASDSPVHWIQLLHALDQQGTNRLSKGPKFNNTVEGKERLLEHCNDASSFEPEKYLPGWPLLSPSKVQMQKCDKCSREFYSPINYRRHILVHRRSLNIDKDSPKNKDFLGAFWDKLSLDEAKEIVSFKNLTLEEVPGSSIIRTLTSFIRKLGVSSLPQVYVKAGEALLDVIQARTSKFPMSSQELFSILDDASEKTFLCAGTAVSVQKFVFDGEAGKIGLEMKNLVAFTGFLVEKILVKAWLADKDSEALRCQKLLVEEEEAAQKRQAELLERKRLKKLRLKEQKAKEEIERDKADFKEGSPDSLEGVPSSETSSPLAASNSHSHTQEAPSIPVPLFLEPVRLLNTDVEAETRFHSGLGGANIDMASNNSNFEHRMQQGSGRGQLIVARRPGSKPHRGALNGFHSDQVLPVSKLGAIQKHGTYKEQRAAFLANGQKVWTRKTKPENEGEGLHGSVQREPRYQPDLNGNYEVLIGSISVTLGDCSCRHEGDILAVSLFPCEADQQPPKQNNVQEKPVKPDSGQNGINSSMVKLWKPVGRHEAGNFMTVQSDIREAKVDVFSGKADDRTRTDENCLPCNATNDSSAGIRKDISTVLEEGADPIGLRLFSSRAAKAFLAQRWKEAIAADHVKLVISPETEPPGCPELQDDAQGAAESDYCKRKILGNAENRLAGVGPIAHAATTGASKAKIRAKFEKGCRLKYIPKQRNGT